MSMGVYIRGMEMPDNCLECPLETDYGTCGYYSLFVEAGHDSEVWKRRDDCPLVEVPPHGRLIDADALNDLINKSYPMTDRVDVHNGYAICQIMIKDLPTVIEAEEE